MRISTRCFPIALPAIVIAFGLSSALAQSSAPIYLEEPEAPPAPQLVKNEINIEKYEDGTKRIERSISRFSDDSVVGNGSYREFYPSGELFADGNFKTGLPAGEWTYYHPNGKVAKKVNFAKGQPTGKVQVFRADGTLLADREYLAGKRSGVWTKYQEDGEQPLVIQSYVDGLADGMWKTWNKEGQLRREWNFKKGKRDGLSTDWDDAGVKRAEASYKAGKRDGMSTVWKTTGEKVEQLYKDGAPVK